MRTQYLISTTPNLQVIELNTVDQGTLSMQVMPFIRELSMNYTAFDTSADKAARW